MHQSQSNIPQCTILKQKCAHVCTFLLQNVALQDICVMHCVICEMSEATLNKMRWANSKGETITKQNKNSRKIVHDYVLWSCMSKRWSCKTDTSCKIKEVTQASTSLKSYHCGEPANNKETGGLLIYRPPRPLFIYRNVIRSIIHKIPQSLWNLHGGCCWWFLWVSYQLRNIAVYVTGMPGTFSPPLHVSEPDMHRGTCVTHMPWCMPGSLTSGFLWSRCRGKRSRHSPGACTTHNFTYLGRGPCGAKTSATVMVA